MDNVEAEASFKLCRKCQTVRPFSDFSKRTLRRPDGLQPHCKSCVHAYYKLYYEAHKEAYNRRRKVHRLSDRREKQRLMLRYLKAHPCVDCGLLDPTVMEFDHGRPVEQGR